MGVVFHDRKLGENWLSEGGCSDSGCSLGSLVVELQDIVADDNSQGHCIGAASSRDLDGYLGQILLSVVHKSLS